MEFSGAIWLRRNLDVLADHPHGPAQGKRAAVRRLPQRATAAWTGRPWATPATRWNGAGARCLLRYAGTVRTQMRYFMNGIQAFLHLFHPSKLARLVAGRGCSSLRSPGLATAPGPGRRRCPPPRPRRCTPPLPCWIQTAERAGQRPAGLDHADLRRLPRHRLHRATAFTPTWA